MSSYTTFNADTGNTNTSINVTGLTNNRYYQFKVSAINSEGVGLPAETISVIPRIAPTAPTNVVGSAGNAQVIVSWTASNLNGGSAIAGYKVEYAESPYSTWYIAVASTTSTSHTVTELTNGDSYKFRVTGTNQFVTGPTSELSSTVSPTAFSASGGTETIYGSLKSHTFTSSGTLSVTGSKDVNFLIVAGGGFGGRSLGGGAGGGGGVSGINYTLTENADLTITIGAGSAWNDQNGTDSQIQGTGFSFKAPGGGAGGRQGSEQGNDGGSGGGHGGWNSNKAARVAKYYNSSGALTTLTGGSVTIVSGVTAYGHPGGAGGRSHYPTGGGGAGGPGTEYTDTGTTEERIAHGGDGVQIDWVTPRALGVTGGAHGVADTTPFYWGGGGGGTQWSNNQGSGDGGKGGGGAGAFRTNHRGIARPGGYAAPPAGNNSSSYADYHGGAAGANTGGGGGGGEYDNGGGGAGGSGIVVIQYRLQNTAPESPPSVTFIPGNTQATVNWTVPLDNGGFAISGYKVEYAADPYSSWTLAVASTSSSPYTVTGLTNGTSYKARVSAINNIGTSTTTLSSAVTPDTFSVTGGTITTYTLSNVNYKLHTFTSSGTLTVSGSKTVDLLIIGGGGGGGVNRYQTNNRGSGGGGAGGVVYKESYVIGSGNYSIVVGSGGTGADGRYDDTNVCGTRGSKSTFNSLEAGAGGGGVGHTGGYRTATGDTTFGWSSGSVQWNHDGNGGSGGGAMSGSAGGSCDELTTNGPEKGGRATGAGSGHGYSGSAGGGCGTDSLGGDARDSNTQGGIGRTLNIGDGSTNVEYGRGGDGGTTSPNQPQGVQPKAEYGGGGNASVNSGRGGDGGDGLFIIRYAV